MTSGEKPSRELLLYRLYRLLIQKYADVITEKERRTIGQVKALVDKNDLTVQSLLAGFKPMPYSFELHYLSAAEKAFQFIQREIAFVKSDIRLSFWLTPKEIVESKVADDEDQAVFFCSILSALGDEKVAVVIAELENLFTHAFVITEYQSRFYLWDTTQQHPFTAFAGFKESSLAKYHFNGFKIKRFLYKFNHSTYEQFL